jgi:hypothetical protein
MVSEPLLPVAVTLLLVADTVTVGFAVAVSTESRTAARDTAASARETGDRLGGRGKGGGRGGNGDRRGRGEQDKLKTVKQKIAAKLEYRDALQKRKHEARKGGEDMEKGWAVGGAEWSRISTERRQ